MPMRYFPPRALTTTEEDAALQSMSLDLAQVCFDMAGFVDPTPVCEGVSTLIALARGDWFSAAMSGISMIPAVGELAKFGKLGKDIRIIEQAIELAGKSDKARELLTPVLSKLSRLMDMFPGNPGAEFTRLRLMTKDFLNENKVTQMVTTQLPDISKHFRFRTFEANGNVYKEASGHLGVPGKVMQHSSAYAQSRISSGTGDDAGHLIGNRFGAPGTGENLGPQNFIQNEYGTFKKLEDYWEKKLSNGTGIDVKVQDVYRRGEDRPFMRKVEWTETSPTGETIPRKLDFANTQTPKSRDARGIPPTVPPGNSAQIFDLRR